MTSNHSHLISRLVPYIARLEDVIAVLTSICSFPDYPKNLSNVVLSASDREILTEYLSRFLRVAEADKKGLDSRLVDVLKRLAIFTELDVKAPPVCVSLAPSDRKWYLL